MKRFNTDHQKISYSLLFSILLHLGFFSFAVQRISSQNNGSHKSAIPTKKMSSIQLDSIKFISKKELKAIKDNLSNQVVANELRGKEEKPVNTRFSGEKNQVFDRQTMARTNGAFKEAGLGVNKGGQAIAQIETTPIKKLSSSPKQSVKKSLSLSDLGGFKLSDVERLEKESEESFKEITKQLEGEKPKSTLGVTGGKAGTSGLAQSNDFVEDVPLGDMTNLNTTENKYYGFYHRIRQKLEQHWGSSIKDKAKNFYRSGRRMPASDNLITAVIVVLNDSGHIVDIQIEGTSGVRELDQAAIESFNKAGPFPNPPKGLLVGGRATIQWGFVVKS